jgi:hypothetical protein
MLGITRQSVWALEKAGVLHPQLEGPDTLPDDKRPRRFDPAEVYAYAMTHSPRKPIPKSDGDIAAAAFGLFDDGVSRNEIVKRLHITVNQADTLWEQWRQNDFETAARERHEHEERERQERADREKTRERQERFTRAQEALGQLNTTKRGGPRQ